MHSYKENERQHFVLRNGYFDEMSTLRLVSVALGSAALLLVASACSSGLAQGATSVSLVTTSVAETTTRPETTTTSTTTTTTTTTTIAPTTTETPTTTFPEVTPLLTPLVAVGRNDGLETARIQERLLELGFWLQLVDGDFGGTTKQAVMAFQKYVGLEPTASVDQATADALTLATTRAVGQSNEPGTLVEVDKDKQVLFIMNSGKLLWALNISTGSGQYFLEMNQKDLVTWETGRSLTPSGHYKINREKADGWWDGDLGQIYRPKYFNGGIAIHGSMKIPNYPASHGCVRVSTQAMDMIWASGLLPKKTPVWVYGNDIEAEGEPPVVPTTTTTTTLPIDPNLTTTIAPA